MPELGILTPVESRNEEPLRRLLRALSKSASPDARAGAGEPSPFAQMPARTHFARLVVIDIGAPHLFFTSRFDGDEQAYLEALAAAPQTSRIWRLCKRPVPAEEKTLRAYFLKGPDRVEASYVLSVVKPQVTVAQVNRALELQAAIGDLAARAHELDAAALSHAFRQIGPVARLAEP
jgi:hypothetical protein